MVNTAATQTEQLSDDLNPQFLFSTTAAALLLDIANGVIDAKELAIRELNSRHLGFLVNNETEVK